MESWLISLQPWGTQVILLIQAHRSGLFDALFLAASGLGSSYGLFALSLLAYWCVDKRLGANLWAIAILSYYVNTWVKYLFQVPRPADPRIAVLWPEASPSFPSGHAQNSLVLAGYVAAWGRRAWLWAIGAVLVALIAFSRVYIGVHYPQDIAGGALLGAAFLGLYLWLGDGIVTPWLRRLPPAAGLMLLLYPRAAAPNTASQLAGLLLGLGVGVALEKRYVRFSVAGAFQQRALRFAVGIALSLAIYAAPAPLLRLSLPAAAELVIILTRHALFACAAMVGAPWLFGRLRLAQVDS
jgi:membrane-associated phospholipid phosphatase